jgi:thiol-disulfide isomerase/thioredoxin
MIEEILVQHHQERPFIARQPPPVEQMEVEKPVDELVSPFAPFPELADLIYAEGDPRLELKDRNHLSDEFTLNAKKRFFEYKLDLSLFVLTEFLLQDEEACKDVRMPIVLALAQLYNAEVRAVAVLYYDARNFCESYVAYSRMPFSYSDGVCMYRIGFILREGGYRFEKDPERSVAFLERAFHLLEGHTGPQEIFTLGYMYRNGIFVPYDFDKAVELYKASAKLDYPAAQNNLGVIYENGETGKPLMKEAYDLFCLAAARGLSTAKNNKARLERRYPQFAMQKVELVDADEV